jgi:hypothetical protein
MNLERMWKEAVVANLRYYPGTGLEGLRKITKISVKLTTHPAKISTWDLPDTKQAC